MEINEKASVTWCSIYDVENFIYNRPLDYKHTYFESFLDFFEYLLDEEEKERSENS